MKSVALSIASNVSSLNAQNNLGRSSSALAKSVERLSSGLKINRGADGPAALVNSEKMRAQIAGLQQAITNSSKAVSLVQTAEGALGEINGLLVKVRGLAIDSANSGVNDDEVLAANQAEISNALDTIARISANTQFGTKKLLNGSAGGQQVTTTGGGFTVVNPPSTAAEGNYAIDVVGAASKALYGTVFPPGGLTSNETITINGTDIALTAGMTESQYLDAVNAQTSTTGVMATHDGGFAMLQSVEFGASQTFTVVSNLPPNVGTTGIGNLPWTSTGLDAVVSIGGTNFTADGLNVTATSGPAAGLSIRLDAEPAMPTASVYGPQGSVNVSDRSLVFQIGANQNQTVKLAIGSTDPASIGRGVAGNQFSSLAEVDVTTATGAQDSIAVIDKALSDVVGLRGSLGAFQQNTLTSTASNLRTTLENTVSAESVIRDTDFAAEIANYTKNQVLVQAGTSILANANQLPQQILSLLR